MGSGDPARARQAELILAQVEALPTLSPVATRLLEVVSSSDADAAQVVRLIESDPAMSARILSLCRRADKGLGDRISTVQHAVVMLGLSAVQAVVLSVSVMELARSGRFEPEVPGGFRERFDRPGFWRHAIAVACAADFLARDHPAKKVKPPDAFIAGLLAGLGKVALAAVMPRAYSGVLATCEERGCAAAPVERAVLGIDHHTAGKRLAEHWALPHALQDVMWLHGQPPASIPDLPHKALITLVTVADALVRQLHLGWSGEFGMAPDIGALCADAGLDRAAVDRVIPEIHAEVGERCRILGVDAPAAPDLLLRSIAAANARLGALNAALEQRSRQARRQARVLEAIADFQSRSHATRGLASVLGEVARSAAGVLGGRVFTFVVQARAGEACQIMQCSGGGELLRADSAELPGPGDEGLAERLGPGPARGLSGLGLLPWLSDYAVEARELGRVALVPLWTAREAGPEGGAAAMLHEIDPGPGSTEPIGALVSCWGAAIAGACRHEGARRLSEEIAQVNRALVEAQARLSEAESMARLGEMAAGAAHEMNNPLAVISGRAQLLASRLTQPADIASAEAIRRATQELTELISSLRLVASPPTPRAGRVAADELIGRAVEFVDGKGLDVGRVRHVSVPGLTVQADRELLARAVSELIANALEASPEGIVEVGAEREAGDGRLLITVRDRGPGMSARAMQHAFDPFFSEKPAGRQTGLGLTRARRLVELHGGRLAVANGPSGGVVARVWIPGGETARSAA